MTARDLIGSGLHVIASGTVTMATATTTAVDFGTPNDINLATVTALAPGLDYVHEDRVVVVLTAVSDGTTDTTSFSVQDADDNSGSIGTPATAITDGTLTGGTGSQYAVTGVRVQSGRPWLRVRATSDGANDTIVVGCVVLGVPRGL
jgi:hypothetical protein